MVILLLVVASEDPTTVQILNIIFAEEISHVEKGCRWFVKMCKDSNV
eukprot:gene6948-16696_t